MARVVITQVLADVYTDGTKALSIDASTVRQMLRLLDEQYPGLGSEIDRSHGVAIDGEFYQDPLAERISQAAEVFVLPKISGG